MAPDPHDALIGDEVTNAGMMQQLVHERDDVRVCAAQNLSHRLAPIRTATASA
jgi:hypothetical protein